jgi:hypothetical protein
LLTRKFLTVYGIVGVTIMSVMFVVVVFKLVPTSWFLPLFVAAFIIWGSRLVLRLLVLKKEQHEVEDNNGERKRDQMCPRRR